MDSLVVPGLDTLRRWLDEIGISFFECDSCQALHLPHMQNFDGIFDAKIDLVDNVVLFSALAEVKPAVQRRRRRACGGKRAIPFSSLNLPKISAATTAAAAYYPLLFCI